MDPHDQHQKSDKIIDEFPTFIASSVPASADASRYELDDFSIYKVGEERQQQQPSLAEKASKILDFDDPEAFEIAGATQQHYVDLDFDLNKPAADNTAFDALEAKPSTPEKVALPQEASPALTQNTGSLGDPCFNLDEETFMQTSLMGDSLMSLSDNSLLENIDPSSTSIEQISQMDLSAQTSAVNEPYTSSTLDDLLGSSTTQYGVSTELDANPVIDTPPKQTDTIMENFMRDQHNQDENLATLEVSHASPAAPVTAELFNQAQIDSLTDSNTLPSSDISAQVATDLGDAKQQQQRPAAEAEAVALKKDPLESELYQSSTVASITEPTSTSSAPVEASLPTLPPSPPPSKVTTAATVADDDDLPQPHNQPKQQQQSEHEVATTESLESSFTNLLHTSASSVDQVLSALQEEAEEEEEVSSQQKNKQTTWSPDYKEENVSATAATEAVEEVVLANKNLAADTLVESLPTSTQQVEAATVPKTRSQPVSLASSSAPDIATAPPPPPPSSTIMGRKNYRRDNSSEEAEFSGPDQVKEYIETILGPNVAELVYWRDPKNTGVVFGIGLVILFSLSIFSVISVVAYTLLFTLLGTLSFRVYKNVLQAVQKTSEGHPFKEYLEIEIAPSQDRIHEIVDSLVAHGTCFANRLRSVLLVEDIVDSLKYLLIFWALTYIGAWFNGLTLVILGYISAFSLPKVYEQNKAQIDQYLDLVNSKIAEISEKIPFLKKVPVEKKEE